LYSQKEYAANVYNKPATLNHKVTTSKNRYLIKILPYWMKTVIEKSLAKKIFLEFFIQNVSLKESTSTDDGD